MERRGFWIRVIYALCLAGATLNHVRAVLRHGWMPDHLPKYSALYWSSLTFLDPLAALLLFIRPKMGIALTVMIIVSDVVHNLWFVSQHPLQPTLLEDVMSSPFLLSQIAFLVFVVVTAPVAWRASGTKSLH